MKAALALALLVAASALAFAAPPALDRARSGPCVEDPAVMRKQHMALLLHGRDETVRRGVRERKASLSGCVDCHASADGRVLGSERHFCQGCHAYAAVKLDCFECHSSRARGGALRNAGGAR